MQNILSRLKRLNGQLTGIARMIERKEDCTKVIVQFQAAQAALDAAFAQAVSENMEQCFAQKRKSAMKKLILLTIKKR
jgi:DNA-binding FrmR family transcriptional regulator